MKKKLIVFLIAAVLIFQAAGCKTPKEPDVPDVPKVKATIAANEFVFIKAMPADITVGITFNDAVFSELKEAGAKVAETGYAVTAAGITFKKEYLTTLVAGIHTLTVKTTVNDLDVKIEVREYGDAETLEQILSNPMYKVDYGSGNGLDKLPESPSPDSAYGRYLRMIAANNTIEIGETVTVTFEEEYWDMRLRPYTNWFEVPGEDASASFVYINDTNGAGLEITSNGEESGNVDKIEFRGAKFVPGGTYRATVKYRNHLTTPTSTFRLAWSGSPIINLNKDVYSSASGIFTVNEPYGLGADIMHNLEILSNSAVPAKITVYELTITRLEASASAWTPLKNIGDKFEENFTDNLIGNIWYGIAGDCVVDVRYFDETYGDVLYIETATGNILFNFTLHGTKTDGSESLLQPSSKYKITFDYKASVIASHFLPSYTPDGGNSVHATPSLIADNTWRKAECELTVAATSVRVYFGFYIGGNTLAYLDNMVIEKIA